MLHEDFRDKVEVIRAKAKSGHLARRVDDMLSLPPI